MVKKLIFTMWCALLVLVCVPARVQASNQVTDISVEVAISEDGSAYITQNWNCNFTEGTECYIPIENLGDMTISDFLVSDGNGAYEVIDQWDIDAGFDEKAGKCGIVKTDKGYELCWGISEYGENGYAIEYKVNGLVGAYDDYDGFNFQFINSGMGTLPTDVTITILMQDGIPLNESNAAIWAFGFLGKINFDNGNVFAYTESPLSSDTDSVIIILQLKKDLLHPARTVEGSFETVKAKALEGSDYDQDPAAAGVTNSDSSAVTDASDTVEYGPIDYILGFMLMAGSCLPAVAIFCLLRRKKNRSKRIGKLQKEVDYCRDVPIGGNIEATFALAEEFGQVKDDGNLIGAAFLKLINAGCLVPMSEKKVGLWGKEKESISLKLVQPPEFSGVTAHMLYEMLTLVSGNDQILQEQELEKYCRKNYMPMMNMIRAAKEDGKNTLSQIGTYDLSGKAKSYGLSERGQKLLLSILGFKKFLLEFSLIGERSISESIIWQDYLTFATLLGIADKALEQFEKVYPEVTQYSDNAHYYYMLAHRYRRASYETAQAARSAGSGGRSSFGGGSGFSGGGRGGGTR